jgi:hypothetical protein
MCGLKRSPDDGHLIGRQNLTNSFFSQVSLLIPLPVYSFLQFSRSSLVRSYVLLSWLSGLQVLLASIELSYDREATLNFRMVVLSAVPNSKSNVVWGGSNTDRSHHKD